MKPLMLLAVTAPATLQEGLSSSATIRLGCLFGFLLLGALVGLIICAVRMKRPTANKKAHLALILLLCGYLLYGAVASLSNYAGLRTAGACGGLVMFAGFYIGAVILSILGLSEVRKERARFREGKGPAVTALVLCGVCAAGVAGAFAFGIVKGFLQAAEMRGASASPDGTPEPEAAFEELCFSIRPPRPWVRIDAKKFNPVAAVGNLRSRPQVYFMIIAEKLYPDSELELESLVEIVKANLASGSQAMKFVEEEKEVVNGVSGVRLVVETTFNRMELTYRYWIHVSPEGAYQLVAWGSRRDGAAVLAEGRKAFDSFTLLQPKK